MKCELPVFKDNTHVTVLSGDTFEYVEQFKTVYLLVFCFLGWVDCEQSLFYSKIPAGRAAKKRVRYSSCEQPTSVGGRAGEERKERLPCFHTAFLKPGTLVTECFDWSLYDAMERICHHRLETCSARQRLPSIELLTATGENISSS